MAKVTMNKPSAALQSATEQLTAEANRSHVVTDSTGRRITLQKPGLLAQFRLVKLVGGDTASNRVYMTMILPVTFVVAIDGVPVPTPSTQAHLDALIQRLDEHGLEACANGLNEFWGADSEAQGDQLEAVKA